jgi:diacylglycerol kinase (ATP)
MRSVNLFSAFRHAFSGWRYAVRTQRNARIHLIATVLVIAVSWRLGLTGEQWCLIVFAIAIVWIAELANTALESLVDLVSPEYHALAKIAKDVKAASVIIAVLAAVIVGGIILLPPLLRALSLFH